MNTRPVNDLLAAGTNTEQMVITAVPTKWTGIMTGKAVTGIQIMETAMNAIAGRHPAGAMTHTAVTNTNVRRGATFATAGEMTGEGHTAKTVLPETADDAVTGNIIKETWPEEPGFLFYDARYIS